MSYFGEHSRLYYKVDEAVSYIEDLVEKIPNIKVVYLPPAQVEGLRRMFESCIMKPEPPKFKTGDSRFWGMFSSSRQETYTYNFNDPTYLRLLGEYEDRKAKFNTLSKLMISTNVGQVEIRANSKLKYKALDE